MAELQGNYVVATMLVMQLGILFASPISHENYYTVDGTHGSGHTGNRWNRDNTTRASFIDKPVDIPANPCGLVDGQPNLVNMSLSLATTTIAQQAAGVRREIEQVLNQVGARDFVFMLMFMKTSQNY